MQRRVQLSEDTLAEIDRQAKKGLYIGDFVHEMQFLAPFTYVVEPDDIVTCEVRMDHSRFFPVFDDEFNVTGGGFG
jgi:hypothetical protein